MTGLSVALHADWLSDAATRIRQPRLRESFATDARMRARVAARLAAEQGLPDAEIQNLNAASRQIIAAISQDPARLVTLTGLVWNARFLSRMVTRDAVTPVLGQVDRKDLVFALKLREFAPAETSFGYEAGKLREFIETAGLRCVLSWLKSQPPGLAGRLRMSLPRVLSFSDEAACLPPSICADILVLAARHFTSREA
jgi:hypothetical protein